MQKSWEEFPEMLGKIYWDPQNNQYDIDNRRPAFKKLIRRFMNNGQNRCHSISFYLLSVLLCDFANHLPMAMAFQNAVTHMEQTFGNGIAVFFQWGGNIPQNVRRIYLNQLRNYANRLRNKIGRAQSADQIENELSQFLSHLNSCPFNLRYPGNPGVNWNQAVGEAFDPRMWCYVDTNGNVISDDTSLNLPGNPLQAYCQNRNLWARQPAVGSGFYIPDARDGYFLNRMMDLWAQGFLSQQYLANPQLEIMTSVTGPGGVPYIASSSNLYALQPPNGFQSTVYYWFGGQWQLF